jgi:hypothetical protein
MTTTPSRLFLVLRCGFAALFGVAAVSHGLRVFGDAGGSVGRHALFVVINLIGALLLVVSPRVALPFLTLLALQQIPSHGSALFDSLRAYAAGSGPIDWASVLVLLFFPGALTMLVFERRASRSDR